MQDIPQEIYRVVTALHSSEIPWSITVRGLISYREILHSSKTVIMQQESSVLWLLWVALQLSSPMSSFLWPKSYRPAAICFIWSIIKKERTDVWDTTIIKRKENEICGFKYLCLPLTQTLINLVHSKLGLNQLRKDENALVKVNCRILIDCFCLSRFP